MPKITKQVISKYIKTDCKRFLALSLYRTKNDKVLAKKYDMPEPIVARPSATIFAKAGSKAESLIYDLIEKEFIDKTIKFDSMQNSKERLIELLNNNLEDKLFLIEPQFVTDDILELFLNTWGESINSFKDKVDMSDIRPDMIIKVLPQSDEIYYEVLKDGTLSKIENFDKTMLSIVDVKNTEKSNSGYDAEVVLYSILLTIWLSKNNLNDKYVVTSKSGIFPAALKVNAFSNEYEPLSGTSIYDKYDELISYIEYIEHDQIAISLRKILIEDIIPILISPEKWEELDWHISKKCGLCDWLAYEDWLSDNNKALITDRHCHIHALSRDHLSQIPFVTPAMRKVLEADSISTLSSIEQTEGNEDIYLKHSKLKIDSEIIPKRASSILNDTISSQDRYIYSIPKGYETLTNIFITLNFDPSTRLVSSISTKCHWKEFYPEYDRRDEFNNVRSFPSVAFFTEEGDEKYERDMLFLFLQQLNEYFEYANSPDNNRYEHFQRSNYHVYFWDRTQFEELKKLIGKHIGVILSHNMFKPLIWLFGTEEVLADFTSIKTPRVSFVKEVIKSNLALNLKFDYSLFTVAATYTEFNKNISKAFYDPFSDYIPKERLYEIWLKHKNYQETKDRYRLTAKSQVEALQFVAIKVQYDLRHLIKGTPTEINFDVFNNFKNITRLPVDSKIWYLHQKLNEEYTSLDNELDSFKEVNELEANYKAIVLIEALSEESKNEWLVENALPSGLFVYKTTEESKNTKIKDESSYLSLGLCEDPTFVNKKFGYICHQNHLYCADHKWALKVKMKNIFQMKIIHFDRENGIIALDISYKKGSRFKIIKLLIEQNIVNLEQSLYLIENSSYSSSVHTLAYLNAIKTPLISYADDATIKAIGLTTDMKGKKTHPNTMAADVLWNAEILQNERAIFSEPDIESHFKKINETLSHKPNERQSEAILNSLRNKLSIIWGPPGTGKTATASILIKTYLSLIQADSGNKNILLSAFTYQACIEIFDKLIPLLNAEYDTVQFFLIKSKGRTEFLEFLIKKPAWMNLKVIDEKDELATLKQEIKNNNDTNIIISPTAALNNLYNDNDEWNAYQNPKYNQIGQFIDFALLDESSQCDLANTLSVLYGLKKSAQLVILGDHLQMPPIHQVKPPLGIEHNVGSFLDYLRIRHKVEPIMLNVNYRSLKDIVNYISTLGYKDLYYSRTTSNIYINLVEIVKNIYSAELGLEGVLSNVLNPKNEVMAITYSDGISSQANPFEAKLVAGLIVDAYNKFYDDSISSYDEWFWSQRIGVVTPHKAQKVLIARLLYSIFPESKNYIDKAIDTVEKFQGSQRRYIIVSFGVGDPDIISDEEEFLLNLNRTNVAISRAEDKVIVIISDELIHHLPEDKEIIKTSKAIKSYVHQYCNTNENHIFYDEGKKINISLRIHK